MNAEQQLNALVDQWQSALCRGQGPTPDELCADCPEMLDLLKKRIAALNSMESFLDEPNQQHETAAADGTPDGDLPARLDRFIDSCAANASFLRPGASNRV